MRRSFGAAPLAEPLNPPVRDAGLRAAAELLRPAALAGWRASSCTAPTAAVASARVGRDAAERSPRGSPAPGARERLPSASVASGPVHALAVADEQVLRLEAAERGARRREPQQQVHAGASRRR